MSHIETIEKHIVHDKLKESIQAVSETRYLDELPTDDQIQLDRIHYVLHMFETMLNKSDPYLVSTSTLDSAYNNLNSITAHVQEYKRSRSSGQLPAAINHVDAICSYMRSIYIPVGPDDIENVKDATVSFRQSLGQYLRYASKESEEQAEAVNKLKLEVEELRKRVESEKSRNDGFSAEFQRQFSQSEASRLQEFKEEITEWETEFKSEIRHLQDEVEKLTSSLEKQFEEMVGKSEERVDGLITEIKDERIETITKGADIIAVLKTYQEQGKTVLGQMSIDGHAAAYKDEADNARSMKHLWQWLTGAAFIALIGSALWNATHVTSDATLTTIASKWVATLAISAAVTYFARQAAKQDVVERDNRYMQLQLATIDPYLGIFEESERKEIKKKLVDRIFTGVREYKENEEKTSGVLTEDIVKILEAVSKVKFR